MDSARPSGGGASGRAGRARPARGRFPGGRRARLLQSTFRGHRSPGLTSAPRSACARPPFWAGTLLHLRAGALMALDSRPSPRPCPPGCLPCKHPGSTSPSACQRRGRHRSLGDLSAPQSEIEAASVRGVSPRTQVPANSCEGRRGACTAASCLMCHEEATEGTWLQQLLRLLEIKFHTPGPVAA